MWQFKNVSVILQGNFIRALVFLQPARVVPATSFESPVKLLISGTSREPSGDSWRTNTKIDDLMKKVFFDAIVLVLHICYWFLLEKNKNWKVLNGDVRGTSAGQGWGTSRGPNDGMFWGGPQGVSYTLFLSWTKKHI